VIILIERFQPRGGWAEGGGGGRGLQVRGKKLMVISVQYSSIENNLYQTNLREHDSKIKHDMKNQYL